MFFIFFIEQLIGSELDYVALGMNMYVVQFFDFNLFIKAFGAYIFIPRV